MNKKKSEIFTRIGKISKMKYFNLFGLLYKKKSGKILIESFRLIIRQFSRNAVP